MNNTKQSKQLKIIKEKFVLLLACLGFVFLMGLSHLSTNIPVVFILGMTSIVICGLYVYKEELISSDDIKFDWKRICWIIFSFLLLSVVGELGDIVQGWEGIEETQNQLINNEAAIHIPVYLDVFLTVFVAPVVEEVLFRGIIPQLLFKHYPKVGFLFSAVLFGLVHSVSSVTEAIIYIGGGLVFSLACYRYGRLTDSLIVHMIYNAL